MTSTTPSQPPAASTMFHHPGYPVTSSSFIRARTSGRAILARTESMPPSNAQLGMVASSPVPPAVYG